MTSAELTGARWHKSSHSNHEVACVEVAELCDGRVAVRDTKDHGHGPALVVAPARWTTFTAGLRAN